MHRTLLSQQGRWWVCKRRHKGHPSSSSHATLKKQQKFKSIQDSRLTLGVTVCNDVLLWVFRGIESCQGSSLSPGDMAVPQTSLDKNHLLLLLTYFSPCIYWQRLRRVFPLVFIPQLPRGLSSFSVSLLLTHTPELKPNDRHLIDKSRGLSSLPNTYFSKVLRKTLFWVVGPSLDFKRSLSPGSLFQPLMAQSESPAQSISFSILQMLAFQQPTLCLYGFFPQVLPLRASHPPNDFKKYKLISITLIFAPNSFLTFIYISSKSSRICSPAGPKPNSPFSSSQCSSAPCIRLVFKLQAQVPHNVLPSTETSTSEGTHIPKVPPKDVS